MRKTRHFGLTVLLTLFVGLSSAFAATGPASVYKVTITKFELYNGTSWITVFSGSSTTIDIASASAGSAAGNFLSGLNVPDGSYTQVRVTPADTFTISGNNGTLYTTAAKAGTPSGCVPTAVAASEAQCSVDVPGGIGTPSPDVLPSTLTVTNGVPSHKIRVNFNVNNAIQDIGGNLYPAAPSVTMTMTAL
jgi:hypothetical protein